jgi:pyruvate,water dikinase
MAGVFTSVLDVTDPISFVQAVDDVLASAGSGLITGAPMAVLVQPQLSPRWGGVLFGADPISGRTDRLLLSACEGGPDRLVSGLDDGWTATLSPRGRVVGPEPADGAPGMPSGALRTLARLAKRAAATFGGPQDIEWAIERDGSVWLLQSRPITTVTGKPTGPVLGTGPLAETFPDPLSPLEADLWLAPMREGLEHALRLTGTKSARALRRSPVARQIDGWAVAAVQAGRMRPAAVIPRRREHHAGEHRQPGALGDRQVGGLRTGERGIAGVCVGEVDEAGPGGCQIHGGSVRARPCMRGVGRLQSADVAGGGAPGTADSSCSDPGHGGSSRWCRVPRIVAGFGRPFVAT